MEKLHIQYIVSSKKIYSSIVIDSWTTTSLLTAIIASSERICKSSFDFSQTIYNISQEFWAVVYSLSEVVDSISESFLGFLITLNPINPKLSFPSLVLPSKPLSET